VRRQKQKQQIARGPRKKHFDKSDPMTNREIAYALTRMTYGVIFLFYGIGKFMGGLSNFVGGMNQQFSGNFRQRW